MAFSHELPEAIRKFRSCFRTFALFTVAEAAIFLRLAVPAIYGLVQRN